MIHYVLLYILVFLHMPVQRKNISIRLNAIPIDQKSTIHTKALERADKGPTFYKRRVATSCNNVSSDHR